MKISPLQAKQIIDFLNETDLKGVEAPIFMDAINNVYAAYQSNNTIDVQKPLFHFKLLSKNHLMKLKLL